MLATGSQIDRYQVVSMLGHGAMATVYRVLDTATGEEYALKVLMVRTSERRMLSESRVQALVSHPNLVRSHDLVEVDDLPALVMELVNGPSLETVVREHGQLTLPQVDLLARQLLHGLAHAHECGLVHRDLKPANVLLDLTPETVVAKLADFGLAKFLDSKGNDTRTNVAMGTPAYMAPEQIRDAKNVDARADVYATGVVLYELLTNTRVFKQSDLISRYHASRLHDFHPVEELRKGTPARMRNALRAALHHDADKRPADARELLELWEQDSRPPTQRQAWSARDIAELERLGAKQRGQEGTPVAPVRPEDVVQTVESGGYDEVPLHEPVPTLDSESTRTAPMVRDAVLGVVGGAGMVFVLFILLVLGGRAMGWSVLPQSQLGEVTASGAARVLLENAEGGRYEAGFLHPGSYSLWGSFQGEPLSRAGEVEVHPGERVRFECERAVRTCERQR